MRTYRIIDVDRKKKVNVAARDFVELIQFSCDALGFGPGCRLFVATDGTPVGGDEDLTALPQHTALVLLKQGETMLNEKEYIYSLLRPLHTHCIDQVAEIREFLINEMKTVYSEIGTHLRDEDHPQTMLSSRWKHPEWFKDLGATEETKEIYMSKRAKGRMSNYLSTTRKKLTTSKLYKEPGETRSKLLIDEFLTKLENRLSSDNYNMDYFNRKAIAESRLCHDCGLFECGGRWNQPKCLRLGVDTVEKHTINPYRSGDECILFQTWHFDHNIELSRSIIPDIKRAVKSLCNNALICTACESGANMQLDIDRYYELIFTKNNLKLVHYVCHDKKSHDSHVICGSCKAMGARKAYPLEQ